MHYTIEYYSAVGTREADLYLLMWKDLQVQRLVQDAPVCVKYMCTYLFVPRISNERYVKN